MPERRPVDTRGFDTFKRLSIIASIVNLSILASLASVRCTYMTRGMRYRRYRGFIYICISYTCSYLYMYIQDIYMYEYVQICRFSQQSGTRPAPILYSGGSSKSASFQDPAQSPRHTKSFSIKTHPPRHIHSKIRLNRRDTRNPFPLRPTRRDPSVPRSGSIAVTYEILFH